MPHAISSTVVPADADTVWRVIRDFDGLPTWHPAITTSELEGGAIADQAGAIRRLTLGDGSTVRESLVALDDRERRLTYAILECPFPVRDYRSTIHVQPVTSTDESFVVWTVLFDSDLDEAERLSAFFARDVFGTGLSGLVSHLSSTDA
ncbi:SRPBCC family protein [Actinomycetospora aeridis]|uniref:SRPBCC family protein n=1 Tax=Actinomycetospora aeridis TaxID=3129231 RepID=A0ABU8N563_9PSEU